ncbi:MAG TPA: hypothetical protein GXX19_09035 [Syntrophomonadaceae bacterium]|nr:hypothetical protein [Syntrophomonadaceae bacterium]
MAKKERLTKVYLHQHALRQYYARGGKKKITGTWVMRRLRNVLAVGADVLSDDLIVTVPLDNDLVALCTPRSGAEGGGWICFTVLQKDWEIV